jgi:hypothetical protein
MHAISCSAWPGLVQSASGVPSGRDGGRGKASAAPCPDKILAPRDCELSAPFRCIQERAGRIQPLACLCCTAFSAAPTIHRERERSEVLPVPAVGPPWRQSAFELPKSIWNCSLRVAGKHPQKFFCVASKAHYAGAIAFSSNKRFCDWAWFCEDYVDFILIGFRVGNTDPPPELAADRCAFTRSPLKNDPNLSRQRFFLHDLVAFAGTRLQNRPIHYCDLAAAIFDGTFPL